MRDLFIKFIKFGIVGASGTIVDFGITALAMLLFGLREYISESIEVIASSSDANEGVIFFILFANLLGFVVAASSNFILNRIWTWKSTDPNIEKQYLKFIMVSVGGLLINLMLIYICNICLTWEFSLFGVFVSRFWISKLIATAVVMFWNFVVNHLYTFKNN